MALALDQITPDTPVRLSDACQLFFAGGLTPRSLRTEIERGNLEAIRIANKDFVTQRAIEGMLEKCRVQKSQPGLSCSKGKGANNGSSVMAPNLSARDMLKASIGKLN